MVTKPNFNKQSSLNEFCDRFEAKLVQNSETRDVDLIEYDTTRAVKVSYVFMTGHFSTAVGLIKYPIIYLLIPSKLHTWIKLERI